ncbi:putative cystine transporter YijE [Pseudoclavibacter triregionum]|nr:putative cystine transporter YijE [Pseudoclavibacter triregionum]
MVPGMTSASAPASTSESGAAARLAPLLAAYAPLVWSTTYLVTALWLPPGRPLLGAVLRVLPVAILLLAWKRTLPSGEWWWKSAVLGLLNFGFFFSLLYVGAYRLPGGLAATLQSIGPLAVIALAFLLLGERPRLLTVLGAAAGALGVAIMVWSGGGTIDPVGVMAAIGSVLSASLGLVLVRRWRPPVDLVTFTSWQLLLGGIALLPLALAVEGLPPQLDLPAWLGYAYLAIFGTALAYLAWFNGVQRTPAGVIAVIGLLNPVSATIIGILVRGEPFGWPQALGMALVLGGVLASQLGARHPAKAADPAATPR